MAIALQTHWNNSLRFFQRGCIRYRFEWDHEGWHPHLLRSLHDDFWTVLLRQGTKASEPSANALGHDEGSGRRQDHKRQNDERCIRSTSFVSNNWIFSRISILNRS